MLHDGNANVTTNAAWQHDRLVSVLQGSNSLAMEV